MALKLREPVIITPRLLPGVDVSKDSWVSIEYAGSDDGRTRYRYYIDGPNLEFVGVDLKSGGGGGTLQDGLRSLMSFLSAAGEAYWAGIHGRVSDNADLFPAPVMEWAYQNKDEIDILGMELEDALLIEE